MLTESDQIKPQGYTGKRTPTQPWSIISIVIISPYTRSTSGNEYALVVEDLYTRYFEVFPLKQQSGKVIKCHVIPIFNHWGPPCQIISDNDKEFINKDINNLISQFNIKFTPTPIGHPCANPVKRCNRTIKPMIVAYVSQNKKNWDEHLDGLKFIYNTSVHTALGVSPFYLNHRRDARSINDINPEENLDLSDVTAWQSRMDCMVELRHFIEQNMLKARERTRKQHEKIFSDIPIHLKIGDLVYYLNKKLSKKIDGYSAKLFIRILKNR